MPSRTPMLLLVLVETEKLRWFVAGLGLDGTAAPLLCSEPGDLAPYQGLAHDEQVAFLRHRLSGVLQRGSHRLWESDARACQLVFVFAGLLPAADGELTRDVAEHFAQWMLNPPVAAYTVSADLGRAEMPPLHRLAGFIEPALEQLLRERLGAVLAAAADPAAWELVPRKAT
jgi:hypothetical protein